PIATREVQRREHQEEGGPSVDPVREADGARRGRDTAAPKARQSKEAEVAVLPRVDQAVDAASRGRLPPPSQTAGWNVVGGWVHRAAFWGVVWLIRNVLSDDVLALQSAEPSACAGADRQTHTGRRPATGRAASGRRRLAG